MDETAQDIIDGKIFIYPTDTLYGLGCDATNEKSVEQIRQIKERDRKKPLSVIAPSKEWIKKNFFIDADLDKYLPGPYTVVLKKKDPLFLKHVSRTDSIGIRIPDCAFTKKVQESGLPFITTSVNLSGKPFATKISEISDNILDSVDVILEAGKLNGRPSTLVVWGKEINR